MPWLWTCDPINPNEPKRTKHCLFWQLCISPRCFSYIKLFKRLRAVDNGRVAKLTVNFYQVTPASKTKTYQTLKGWYILLNIKDESKQDKVQIISNLQTLLKQVYINLTFVGLFREKLNQYSPVLLCKHWFKRTNFEGQIWEGVAKIFPFVALKLNDETRKLSEMITLVSKITTPYKAATLVNKLVAVMEPGIYLDSVSPYLVQDERGFYVQALYCTANFLKIKLNIKTNIFTNYFPNSWKKRYVI